MAEPALSPLGLGTLTDLAIIVDEGGEVLDRGDYLVVRSPAMPGYYWGNFLQLRVPTASRSPQEWLDVFTMEHPGAVHRTFGLADLPDMTAWGRLGFTSDVEETLATDTPPTTAPCPVGYTSSAFTVDDWEQQVELDLRTDASKGHDPTSHRDFLVSRTRARQDVVRRGTGQWFGAHDADDQLVASVGIRVLPDPMGSTRLLARYQHVVTDAAHRRRGLAAHLLGEAGAWAAAHGAQAWVICTETTNPAQRVYRRAGFEPQFRAAGLERYPSTNQT